MEGLTGWIGSRDTPPKIVYLHVGLVNGRKSIYERLPNGMQLFIEAQKRKGIQHIAEWPFR